MYICICVCIYIYVLYVWSIGVRKMCEFSCNIFRISKCFKHVFPNVSNVKVKPRKLVPAPTIKLSSVLTVSISGLPWIDDSSPSGTQSESGRDFRLETP